MDDFCEIVGCKMDPSLNQFEQNDQLGGKVLTADEVLKQVVIKETARI